MKKLTLGLPKGSLQARTIKLFALAGIDVAPSHPRIAWKELEHELIEKVLWLNPRDIPYCLAERIVNIALTGSDCMDEWKLLKGRSGIRELIQLPYSKTMWKGSILSLIAKRDERSLNAGLGDLVVTEFPNITSYAVTNATIITVRGEVEALVAERFRFGVTIVDSGESLEANKLKVLRVLRDCVPTLYSSDSFVEHPDDELAYELAQKLKYAYQTWRQVDE